MREASKKNLLEQAEQQLTGAHYYARGGGMTAVCIGMGPTQEEWSILKPQCEWLNEDEVAEIEEALTPNHQD